MGALILWLYDDIWLLIISFSFRFRSVHHLNVESKGILIDWNVEKKSPMWPRCRPHPSPSLCRRPRPFFLSPLWLGRISPTVWPSLFFWLRRISSTAWFLPPFLTLPHFVAGLTSFPLPLISSSAWLPPPFDFVADLTLLSFNFVVVNLFFSFIIVIIIVFFDLFHFSFFVFIFHVNVQFFQCLQSSQMFNEIDCFF